MKKITIIIFLALVMTSFSFNCSDKNSSPTASDSTAAKEIIKIGDTIDKVREVYGNPDFAMNFYFENSSGSVSGYLFQYTELDLTFIFDDSSPRRVVQIDGSQGG